MKLAITSTEIDIREQAPIVFRGDTKKCLSMIKEIGYEGVELHIHDSAQLDRRELKSNLEKQGLDLIAIGTGSGYGKEKIFLASEDEIVRNKAIQWIKNHIITAADYDHAVVIIGLIKGKISDCSNNNIYEQNLFQSLKICAEFAEEHNVYLGIELINRYESDYLNSIQEGIELLDKIGSPNLMLHIDTFHMNIEESNIEEAIYSAKDKICHVHISDNNRYYAGHGHYDFLKTIQALKDINYRHALSVETLYYPDSYTSAERSYEHIKAIKDKIS